MALSDEKLAATIFKLLLLLKVSNNSMSSVSFFVERCYESKDFMAFNIFTQASSLIL